MEDLFVPSSQYRELKNKSRQFTLECIEPQAHEFNKKEQFNVKLLRKMGDYGLLGITVPQQWGGEGLDALASVIVHEELSYSDPSFCLAYLAHSILCCNNIAVNANEEQKSEFLPLLCSGKWIGGMAMTEPEHGTDVLSMQTTAINFGEFYEISGIKRWITNGVLDDSNGVADVLYLYAKTGEHNGRVQISSFVINTEKMGSFKAEKIHDKSGMRAANTAQLYFDKYRVPVKYRIGVEGSSLHHMMSNLQLERLTLASISLGIAKRCIEVMVQHAKNRKAFGKAIGSFGQIQKYIADSYAEFMSARTYVYSVASKLKVGETNQRIDCDAVKLLSSTMAKNIADRSIQVLGGYGYIGEHVVERLWRDSKLLEIGGGTIEAHQKNISRDLLKKVNPLFD